ncbi:MAG: preprotein translocase subunit SecY [Candidatus Yanofskybacteria bacterium]|nr:preprotein translocase subunit SecY [Candidatus Yanofskybacteria bacterium]
MGVFSNVLRVFKIHDLRGRILFVLGVFLVFRIMANIPVPGIDALRLREFFEGNQIFGLLNLFTGGTMDSLSIVMLGLGPYITATIIMQLLTMIFPALNRLYKEEGEQGRQKFNQYGRMLTVPFAYVQGYGFLMLLTQQGVVASMGILHLLGALTVIAAGTMLLVWLGELISEKGIGNGVSLLIFAGIVAMVPQQITQFAFLWDPARLPIFILFFCMALAIIAGVVYVTQARRNIPVSYAKRVRGNKMFGGASTYLPLSVNPAGVIPIIFALALLTFPGMIASFFVAAPGILGQIALAAQSFFTNPWATGLMYFGLVIMFTFFYTAVTFDPKSISSNLQKMGGFIPGVRPGTPTTKFLSHILNRILVTGALFLATIAVMPSVIQGLTDVAAFEFLVGGTAVLIIVNVVLETLRQLRAQLQMREYDTF